MSDHSRFAQLADEFGHRGHLAAALAAGGSTVFSTVRRGVTSTPKSAGVFSSIGFFLAFMMLGRLA